MKFSKIVALTAVVTAVLAGGCRYNKAAKSAGSNSDLEGKDIAGVEDTKSIDDGSMAGSLDSIGEKRFEDMYARCTDVEFMPVFFAFDSSVVPPGELGKVDAVARHLVDKPERVVVVEGNCDERGSNEYNMSLGQNRAQIATSSSSTATRSSLRACIATRRSSSSRIIIPAGL